MAFANSALSLLFVLVLGVISMLYFRGRAPQNHYEALGLYRSATSADIKSQFRRTALRYHPDKNPGDESAISKFHALVEARDVLLDPEKRRAYDDQLDSARASQQHHQQQRQQQHEQYDFFHRRSWDCETATCWWLAYFRDTCLPLVSPWGMCVLIFYLGIGTVVSDWFIPKVGWLIHYALCHCVYQRVLRTSASKKAEAKSVDEMRERMRQRWTNVEVRRRAGMK